MGARRAHRDLRSPHALADRTRRRDGGSDARGDGDQRASSFRRSRHERRRLDAGLQRLFSRRRRDRRRRLCELRHARRLRAAEGDESRRQGQGRSGEIRRRLARHQAESRLRARRRRVPHLLGPARRWLLCGRRVSGRAVQAGAGRAARQRDGHADSSRRSIEPGLGVGTWRQEADA